MSDTPEFAVQSSRVDLPIEELVKMDWFMCGPHQWDQAVREIQALQKQLEWIPCSEELPEEELAVLVYFDGYGEIVAYRRAWCWMDLDHAPLQNTDSITHWLPIPGLKAPLLL